jgi:hypothetical protein
MIPVMPGDRFWSNGGLYDNGNGRVLRYRTVAVAFNTKETFSGAQLADPTARRTPGQGATDPVL